MEQSLPEITGERTLDVVNSPELIRRSSLRMALRVFIIIVISVVFFFSDTVGERIQVIQGALGVTPSVSEIRKNSDESELPFVTAAVPQPFQRVAKTPIKRNVLLVIYNPKDTSGKKLTDKLKWNNPDTLTSELISWFSKVSRTRLQYSVKDRIELDAFPYFEKGASYTNTTYETCLNNTATCYKNGGTWAMLDYQRMLTEQDVCRRVNSGEIQEVWLFGGPYFGYYESRLAGSNAYWYNAEPITTSSCTKIVPIMGFSYERGLSEMVEDFGHRTEATFMKLYGPWNMATPVTHWDFFTVNSRSSRKAPAFGIGTVHLPANGVSDYDWENLSVVSSYADEFIKNYPKYDIRKTKQVTCEEWGCTSLGYFAWWYAHMPYFEGKSADGKLQDWWEYVADPGKAL